MAKTLFDSERMPLDEALAITADSLTEYGSRYRHWVLAYSGGKDSTATLAATIYLVESGRVPRPESLTVLYADTRQELPPLQVNALDTLAELRRRGFGAEAVVPAMDDRFFVYMFGRGVPPPTNTFRWCTDKLKIAPMGAKVAELAAAIGERPLLLIGLRVGESAARDKRIALACGRNGGECGQGWFQERPPRDAADTLSPLLHWRTCHVWDWLMLGKDCHGLDCRIVAEVYDQDVDGSANEIAARTGCVGCPLASQDFSLQRLIKKPQWAYLSPLRRLKPLYEELRKHHNRLRKGNDERRVDGSLVANPGRIGPLTMDARRHGLAEILAIQDEVNAAAAAQGRPDIDLINAEEEARIEALIAANTWPNRWSGEEMPGDTPLPKVFADGSVQHELFGE